jgi:hypothetical protein
MFKFLSVLMMAFAIALVPAMSNAETKAQTKTTVKAETGKAKTQVKTSSKTATKASTTAKVANPAKVKTREIVRIERDVHRLESLLAGVKTSAKLSDKSWKTVSNEADTLANRIYTNAQSAKVEKRALRTAENLRNQVRQMKKEAHQGDYKRTRRHAGRALALAVRLDEWAG